MKLRPIQPRITTNAPEVMAHTTSHACSMKGWA